MVYAAYCNACPIYYTTNLQTATDVECLLENQSFLSLLPSTQSSMKHGPLHITSLFGKSSGPETPK